MYYADILNTEYVDKNAKQINLVCNSKWNDKIYKRTIRNQIEELLRFFRHNIVAHSCNQDIISLKEINLEATIHVFDEACNYFQMLSFEPDDIYEENVLFGYDFNDYSKPLFAQEEISLASFILPYLRADAVNSLRIKKVSFEYDEGIEKDIKQNLDEVLLYLNENS